MIRTLRSTIFLLVALVVSATAEQKEWRPLPPLPYSGPVTDIAANDNEVLYMTTGENVYRSTDNGITWIPFGAEMHWEDIRDIATDPGHPDVLVVATGEKIFWTMDAGIRWNFLSFDVDPQTGVGIGANEVYIHPSSQFIIADNYLLRMDGTWQKLLQGTRILKTTVTDNNSILGITGTFSSGTILRSTDGGLSWTSTATVSGVGPMFTGKNSRVYGLFEHTPTVPGGTDRVQELMYSDDTGATWTSESIGFDGLPQNNVRLVVLGIDKTDNRIFASVDDRLAGYTVGVYYSDDNMQTWHLLDPDLEYVQPVEMLKVSDDRIFFTTRDRGTLEYNPLRTLPVAERNNSLVSQQPNFLFVTRTGTMIARGYYSLMISGDTGQTWHRSRLGEINLVRSILDLPSGDLLAGTLGKTGSSPALYRSTDVGQTWIPAGETLVLPGSTWTLIAGLFSDNTGRLYAYTNNTGTTVAPHSLFTSTDNGANWQLLGTTLSSTAVSASGVIYTFGTSSAEPSGFFRSFDLGVTWDTLALPADSFNSQPELIPGPNNSVYISASTTSRYVLNDNSTTWQEIEGEKFQLFFDRAGNEWRVYPDMTVHFVERGSTTPVDLSTGLPSATEATIINISFDANNVALAALSDGRIFKLFADATSDVNDPRSGCSSSSAYPNPFTDGVNISYSLPAASPVTLTLTDILGRVVRTLYISHQQAGPQTLSLEGNPLAPGLYIYKILAGNSVQTGTIVRR